MKVFSFLILILGFVLLQGWGAEAQLSHCSSKCYPLTSEEATNILQNSQSPLYDGHFKWVPDKVGQGFICLDYCPYGELAISEGAFKAGRCTYTITNTAQADMIGRTTEIVLRRIPADNPISDRCI